MFVKDPFTVLDDVLIEKVFEKFSRWFQVIAGKTNFFWARNCFFFGGTTMSVFITSETFSPALKVPPTPLEYAVFVFSTILLFLMAHDSSEKEKKHTFPGQANGDLAANNERLSHLPARNVFIVGTALCSFLLLRATPLLIEVNPRVLGRLTLLFLVICSYTIGLYFRACTPLTPTKGKLREWVTTTKRIFATKTKPIRAPS